MSDDDEKKGADVVPLQTPQTDLVYQLADVLTKTLAAAQDSMTPAQVIAALKLSTDAYGAVLQKSIGQEATKDALREGISIRRTYTFTSEWLDHVTEKRREHKERTEKRDEAKPRAKVIELKRKKKDENKTT